MKETITVFTGEIKTGTKTVDLRSSPLGSCVVVVLFDKNGTAGGMAHIMLPGKAPCKKDVVPGRYAQNALDLLIQELSAYGLNCTKLKAAIVGGGNVLKREHDSIGSDNLDSVNQILKEYKIEVVASSVKGTERKTVRFDIEHGVIFFTKGDDPEKELYRTLNAVELTGISMVNTDNRDIKLAKLQQRIATNSTHHHPRFEVPTCKYPGFY